MWSGGEALRQMNATEMRQVSMLWRRETAER